MGASSKVNYLKGETFSLKAGFWNALEMLFENVKDRAKEYGVKRSEMYVRRGLTM